MAVKLCESMDQMAFEFAGTCAGCCHALPCWSAMCLQKTFLSKGRLASVRKKSCRMVPISVGCRVFAMLRSASDSSNACGFPFDMMNMR